MKEISSSNRRGRWSLVPRWWPVLLALVGMAAPATGYQLSSVTVLDATNGLPIPIGYRWLIQEDTTKPSVPGQGAVPGQNLSVSFYTSFAPPVGAGCIGCLPNSNGGVAQTPPPDVPPTTVELDPNKRYFISVLPTESGRFENGGAAIAAGQTEVTITLNRLPLPTAQLSVLVFEDNAPINNEPDQPQEAGLANFSIFVYDAGGRYGISGGQMSQDAWGNPIGTEYATDASGNVILNPDGTPQTITQLGQGFVKSDVNGEAIIKYLPPGKFTVFVIPPAGEDWHQTATIEGTKGIDAWVKAKEPPFFVEFGPPGYHVFVGFVRSLNDSTVLAGGPGSVTLQGSVVNMHGSRPPDYYFYAGDPVPRAWVGLNDLTAGAGNAVYAQPCDPNTGAFQIANVPPGSYQLVFWDDNLDVIFASTNVTVNPDGTCFNDHRSCDLQEIPVFSWFHRYQAQVFADDNQNGFRDPGEIGIPGQALNIRFRDGSIYQSGATDPSGEFIFREVFPFFDWLIAEVDFLRYKATGATIVVDAGGAINPADPWTFGGKLNPQPQSENGGAPYRVETGPVLLEGFQGFLSQTNAIQWGKSNYGPTENGGITGIVQYASTRAEDDPRQAVADPWEPGIPRVQVALYRDDLTNATGQPGPDGIVDDVNGSGAAELADVDNYPFGWQDGSAGMGPEDVKRNGDIAGCTTTRACAFSAGDAITVSATDSWDDNQPTGCQGPIFILRGIPTDCYDGLRNYNQVRPAVFDGGFAFGSPAGEPDLAAGTYIVEATPPPGYVTVKEEDKNVDFGNSYTPPNNNPEALPSGCVGDLHLVPDYLALFPGDQIPSPFAGQMRPLCDRKEVVVKNGTPLNAAANFFMFTEAPIASQAIGFILDDLSNEFNQYSPAFMEKYAPPWLPVSIRDWTGREISRVYADEFGAFNFLLPSTYSANVPIPSGYSPSMMIACMNSPGPIVDRRPGSPTYGKLIEDPYFNRQYSQFCYTLQYMPGTTTYLDTPVVPVAAFAGPSKFQLDCEFPDGTPVLYSVSGPQSGRFGGGPWLPPFNANGPVANRTLTIVSEGQVEVPNPLYDGPGGTQPKTIFRNYGFGGSAGSVTLTGGGTTYTLELAGWTDGTVLARLPLPNGVPVGEYQLTVTKADGRSTITGITVTVGQENRVRWVRPGAKIQAAIDAAPDDALILVPPGTYEEAVIMWHPVRLQGWGAGSTVINVAKVPGNQLTTWRQRVDSLVRTNTITLLPGQETNVPPVGLIEPVLLFNEESSGVMVLAKDAPVGTFGQVGRGFGRISGRPNAHIDGFTITGSDHGGAIFVNGYARWLQVANNRIVGNQGFFAGGIRVGHPGLMFETAGGLAYTDNQNDNVSIHHNHINQNGGLDGYGGGISICTGTTNYQVVGNFICGNFTQGEGGGIGHFGRSNGGTIARNTIAFNQSFYQGTTVNGGGIIIAGAPPIAAGQRSPGSGTVTIDGNLIIGNMAGAGDGGAIRAQFVNGQDVAGFPNNPNRWFSLNLFNNVISDNVTGLAGAISLQDVVLANIVNNTVANNDSTGTAGAAFNAGNPNQSNPQVAGLVARVHSAPLYTAIGTGPQAAPYKTWFTNAYLRNDVFWHNRSFYFLVDQALTPPYTLVPNIAAGDAPVYADLAVVGTPAVEMLSPQYCILTDGANAVPSATNVIGVAPQFLAEYVNGSQDWLTTPPEATTMMDLAAAFDEGGNFIDLRFGPLTLTDPTTGALLGDYRLQAGSPARNVGFGDLTFITTTFPSLAIDFDGTSRASYLPVDIGADERP